MPAGLPRRRPILVAAALTAAYLALGGGFAWLAPPAPRLVQTAYLAATGLALFLLAWLSRRQLARAEDELARAREELKGIRNHQVAVSAASVAHDINNILSVLGATVEALYKSGEWKTSDVSLAAPLTAAVDELALLSRHLMNTERPEPARTRAEADLTELVRETVAFVSGHRRVRTAELTVETGQPLTLELRADGVQQMLMNLIVNAADSTAGRGRILVRLYPREEGAVLEVHDDGPGVPEDQRAAIFEPFFTTKPQGNGLGLTSVRACAEEHGGTVEVDRSHLNGACFRIFFPFHGSSVPAGFRFRSHRYGPARPPGKEC